MSQHIGYWSGLIDEGTAPLFGPVADPAGVWGLATVATRIGGRRAPARKYRASAERPPVCKRVDASDSAARIKRRGGWLRRAATGESSDG
jgi:hypothetical protein